MKIRTSYVSNSSSASFIVKNNISLENLENKLKEALLKRLIDEAKARWQTDTLTRRQLRAVVRDLPDELERRELSVSVYKYKERHDGFCFESLKDLDNHKEIKGDDYFLSDLESYLMEDLNIVHVFWG